MLGAPLLVAVVLAGTGPGAASASTCGSAAGQPVSPGTSSSLGGVAVVACQAWAVGDYSNGSARLALIERWNGTNWAQVPSITPANSFQPELTGGTAISANDAWAVGGYIAIAGGFPHRTLIEHWNGTTWT